MARTFFDEELSFATIRTKHAIADKAPAIADEHADFAERFESCMHVATTSFERSLATDDFQQPHDIRGAEEMGAMTDSGREVADAMSSMLKVEVLLARMAPGLHLRSNSWKMAFLRAMPSKTASITRSTFEKSSYVSVGVDALQAVFGNLW